MSALYDAYGDNEDDWLEAAYEDRAVMGFDGDDFFEENGIDLDDDDFFDENDMDGLV